MRISGMLGGAGLPLRADPDDLPAAERSALRAGLVRTDQGAALRAGPEADRGKRQVTPAHALVGVRDLLLRLTSHGFAFLLRSRALLDCVSRSLFSHASPPSVS